jgi:hypothetical protein
MTPYAVHSDCELRTGLGVPPTQFWASCNVVVRRSSNARGLAGLRRQAGFYVVLSREELQEADNECLWREVTAHVPFAEWVRLEVMQKDWNLGRLRVRRVDSWRPWHSTARAQHSEDSARDLLFELQEDMVRAADLRAAGGRQEWTLVVHAR